MEHWKAPQQCLLDKKTDTLRKYSSFSSFQGYRRQEQTKIELRVQQNILMSQSRVSSQPPERHLLSCLSCSYGIQVKTAERASLLVKAMCVPTTKRVGMKRPFLGRHQLIAVIRSNVLNALLFLV